MPKLSEAQIITAAVTAALIAVRGITQEDLDTSVRMQEYPNKEEHGNVNQVVVENKSPPVRQHRFRDSYTPTPKISQRKFQAVYTLKAGQSSFYPLPEKKHINQWQKNIRQAASHATKYSKNAVYITQRAIEDSVVGIRIYRVK